MGSRGGRGDGIWTRETGLDYSFLLFMGGRDGDEGLRFIDGARARAAPSERKVFIAL